MTIYVLQCFVFRHVVDEINADPDLVFSFLVADTPERHVAKGIVGHGGKRACELCVGTASTAGGVHWPAASTMSCPLRHHDHQKFIAK